MNRHFYLLQVNDALFPIGGYSHSYGLETYIQKGIIQNAEDASKYLHNKLCYNLLYNDLLAARLAYEYSKAENMQEIIQLNQLTEAGKVPAEIRDASKKMGSRFLKTIKELDITYESDFFQRYTESIGIRNIHHACLYGAFCAAVNIEEDPALSHYLYAQTSAIVTTCVKTIPLSQTDGQKILNRCFPTLEKILDQVMELGIEMYGLSAPGFDIRCMQHEALYSRIYMS